MLGSCVQIQSLSSKTRKWNTAKCRKYRKKEEKRKGSIEFKWFLTRFCAIDYAGFIQSLWEAGGQVRDICAAYQKSLTKVKSCLRLKLQSPVCKLQQWGICRMSVAYRSTCRPTLAWYIDQDVLVKISTEISADNTSRLTHRPRVGR